MYPILNSYSYGSYCHFMTNVCLCCSIVTHAVGTDDFELKLQDSLLKPLLTLFLHNINSTDTLRYKTFIITFVNFSISS